MKLSNVSTFGKIEKPLSVTFVSELNELIIPEGGFHADLISEKVKLLLQSFENDVFPQLESTFNETEKSIKMFGDRLNDLDESGRTKVVWEE